MMDTVLNIGLNDKTVQALAKQSGNERFAWDSYRRLLQMYGDVVMGLKGHKDEPFEQSCDEAKNKQGVKLDNELNVESLKELVAEFKEAIKKYTGKDFPTDPMEQVWGAIGAVFGSWMNDRAMRLSPAVRHSPRVGHGLQRHGDGLRQPGRRLRHRRGHDARRLARHARHERRLPDQRPGRRRRRRHPHDQADRRDARQGHAGGVQGAGRDRQEAREALPEHAGHRVHDLSATRSRCCKRATPSGPASPPCASPSTWSNEGLISKEEAISAKFIPADDLNQLLQPIFDPEAKKAASKAGKLLTKGINAGPGAATGKIVLLAAEGRGAEAGQPEGGA